MKEDRCANKQGKLSTVCMWCKKQRLQKTEEGETDSGLGE